jgi:alpha-2-macroglobulin
MALDLYFHTYEKTTPDFVAKVWLGDKFAGDHTFKGRQTDRHQIDVPMTWIADDLGGKGDLVVQKDGKGRLYYRIGMSYAPEDLKLPAADYGFTVERRYEAVDDPADVVHQKDGTWKIKIGSKVRVRLTMVAENRRYHVALVDPLPAGLETMNPELAVTGPIPQDPNAQKAGGAYWWWYRTWYEHQNLRDERVEAFTTLLWEGVHEYTYLTRATTPGNFVVPQAKAEEMYMPETFGRSATDRVIIE